MLNLLDRIEEKVILYKTLEIYRSGCNEPHSKCGCPFTGTWVQIPLAPLFVNIRIITEMFENPLNITVLELFYFILFFHFSHLYDTKYDTT